MPEEFVNTEEEKVQDEMEPDLTEQQRIDQVAKRLAGKPAATEKKFDDTNGILFNK